MLVAQQEHIPVVNHIVMTAQQEHIHHPIDVIIAQWEHINHPMAQQVV